MKTFNTNPWPILCLMGPTGSGKTALSLMLAKHWPFEIVSVDSQAVYRDMNIGTAKPTPDLLNIIPHHLINICDPKERYSAGQFYHDAIAAIHTIRAQNKIPLLVGGTMLYFRILEQGISQLPETDAIIHTDLQKKMHEHGLDALYNQLEKIDALTAQRVHRHDQQRILRALAVYLSTNKALSVWQAEQKINRINPLSDYQIYYAGILPSERSTLHEHVATRFDQMLADGLVDEVRHLYERGDLSMALPSMRGVGYKQVFQYLSGIYDYDQMRERAIIATRQLIKHQLTWLHHWSYQQINYFQNDPPQTLCQRIMIWFKNHCKITA